MAKYKPKFQKVGFGRSRSARLWFLLILFLVVIASWKVISIADTVGADSKKVAQNNTSAALTSESDLAKLSDAEIARLLKEKEALLKKRAENTPKYRWTSKGYQKDAHMGAIFHPKQIFSAGKVLWIEGDSSKWGLDWKPNGDILVRKKFSGDLEKPEDIRFARQWENFQDTIWMRFK